MSDNILAAICTIAFFVFMGFIIWTDRERKP